MITGLFADTLKACANWFLYIFISADAPLNSKIMNKRAWQIKILKTLDAINTTYNYAQLTDIVYEGIVEMYGLTPAQVLTTIYNTATTGVTGVGSAISDKATAQALENLKNLQFTTTQAGTTTKKNFWTGLTEVLEYIKEILNILGVNVNTTTAKIRPDTSEWVTPSKSGSTYLSSVGDILPWVMAGTIIYALSTGTNKKQQKQKER